MRKAFTLVELLGAIAVLAILSGVAINVFFPSLSQTYVAMVKSDMAKAAQRNLEHYTKYGQFVYTPRLVKPGKNGMVHIASNGPADPGDDFPMTYPEMGFSYEARFDRGTCSDTGKPGMILKYYLNRANGKKPVLYGKYDSCRYAKVRVWEKTYKDGKEIWIER